MSSGEKPGLGSRFGSPDDKERDSQESYCSEIKENPIQEKALAFNYQEIIYYFWKRRQGCQRLKLRLSVWGFRLLIAHEGSIGEISKSLTEVLHKAI